MIPQIYLSFNFFNNCLCPNNFICDRVYARLALLKVLRILLPVI